MDDLTARAKALLAGGGSLDDVMGLLREAGYSKGRTMVFLAEELGMDGDVPILVHRSPVWADRLETDARFSGQALELLDSLRTEPGDGPVDLTDWPEDGTGNGAS